MLFIHRNNTKLQEKFTYILVNFLVNMEKNVIKFEKIYTGEFIKKTLLNKRHPVIINYAIFKEKLAYIKSNFLLKTQVKYFIKIKSMNQLISI